MMELSSQSGEPSGNPLVFHFIFDELFTHHRGAKQDGLIIKTPRKAKLEETLARLDWTARTASSGIIKHRVEPPRASRPRSWP